MSRIYLTGLNALRAIAAFVVVLFHYDIEFAKPLNIASFTIYGQNIQASLAVTLFFVLSGYLITFLLLLEKEKNSNINIQAFYIRRVLRIWPVYFIVIFSVFSFNYIVFQKSIFVTNPRSSYLYLFFLGNAVEPFIGLQSGAGSNITALFVLWSVGVEEQFYLIWPWLTKYSKRVLVFLIGFIFCYLIVKLYTQLALPPKYLDFLNLTRLDCMAIGALGAFLVRSKENQTLISFKNLLYNKTVQVFVWMLFISAFTFPIHLFSFLDHEVYSVVFIIAIMNISMNKNSLVRLENKIFNFLGQISYGVYMYHTLIMIVLVSFIKRSDNTVFSYFLWLIAVLFVTVVVSYLSNRYVENYFIRLKKRFQIIRSTNEDTGERHTSAKKVEILSHGVKSRTN